MSREKPLYSLPEAIALTCIVIAIGALVVIVELDALDRNTVEKNDTVTASSGMESSRADRPPQPILELGLEHATPGDTVGIGSASYGSGEVYVYLGYSGDTLALIDPSGQIVLKDAGKLTDSMYKVTLKTNTVEGAGYGYLLGVARDARRRLKNAESLKEVATRTKVKAVSKEGLLKDLNKQFREARIFQMLD